MMYAKLIFKNAKRSGKDYLIYIVTMTLCVTLFYAFLSISSTHYHPTIGAEYNISLPVSYTHLDVYKRQVYATVMKLPEKQAKRIYARYYLGMAVNEIAEVEGVDPSRVRDSIRRGLKQFGKYF